ncbi:uncharacterized protein N7473_010256 [Penicillium subrubescens]|uniref:uncharacterized protein n=1 Tax=Penicillium subrubescens TaxID=1316194 RepID=UPI0025456B10|nr:uncharacterized protein N7473_010256 [Penicillium subrubescens]KAJ5883370.1 hypothetical protein N7473_010256 [Penicillium subrubescens]
MTSTTLMTFLLTTNPEIRSVKLLGSWDNFTKPYPMERDRRVGPGQWRGCHTFTDIIGDGPPGDRSQWRTGGLKMGATYWYYYLLDNDVEYFSQAEPVTTKCPFLPGQPVNVLNVPIILPDSSHTRSSSSSSQKSNYRTMNPEDKFMNPRKPPKPSLARLQTSVPYPQNLNPASTSPGLVHRSASQPNSATRKYHHGKDARSVSPPRNRALPPFRAPQETKSPKWTEVPSRSNTVEGRMQERRNVPGNIIIPGPASSSANHPELHAASTLQTRRAMKTNGSEPGQGRNLLTVETRPHFRKPSVSRGAAAGPTLRTVDETQALKDALTLVNSNDLATPKVRDIHEKRLPTLPNTPSSVMDEAVHALDETDKAMNAQVLRSHFSSLTTTTAESIHSRFIPEHSRFSEWSTDTETETEDNSPESMISTSTFNQETTDSPAIDDWHTPELSQANDTATNTDPNTPPPDRTLQTVLPQLRLRRHPPLEHEFHGHLPPPTHRLGIDQMDEVESNPKRHAALFSALESMESLSLSRSPDGSPILLPDIQRRSDAERSDVDEEVYRRVLSRASSASFRGNSTMQEIMDELSYLKNMIQTEMDGEPF